MQASSGGAIGGPSAGTTTRRGRSSSLVSVTEIKENYNDALDKEITHNLNADWVNYKGAWLIHIVILLAAKILLDIIPGMRQDYSWSMLNIGYCIVSYMIFHYVTGVPFDATSNSGVYDRLTLWEQIDSGAQYTPAKKWLTTVPIAVFLAATHYTRFDAHPALFTLNLISLALIGLAPKLPYFHRIRIRFFDSGITPDPSGPPTPIDYSTRTFPSPSICGPVPE